MRTMRGVLRAALVLPFVAGIASTTTGAAVACDAPTEQATAIMATSRRDVPITADGKVTLKMTAPTELGRDGRYHDVTMELINPNPVDYHAVTAEVAFTDLPARYLRLEAATPAGTTAVPLAASCDAVVSGVVADRIELPAGSAQTLHLRIAAAMSTPDTARAVTMMGSLRIADSSFKWSMVPAARFETRLVDRAPASADQPVTRITAAESVLGGPGPATDPTTAPPAPAATASTPVADLASPLVTHPAVPGTADDPVPIGLVAVVATILLVSSLGAAAMLNRPSHR